MTILDLFDGALAERADAFAYDELGHGALHAGARRVATRFAELGLRRGDRIVLYSENRVGFAYAYLAALRSGLVTVPANVLYRASDLQHLLANSGAARVVVSAQTGPHLAALAAAPPAIDVAEVERWAEDAAIERASPPPPKPDDVALIVYTSGTTGRSKGAMLTHGNLAAMAAQLLTSWRWQDRDVLLIALPLFHVHGLCAGLNSSLAAGARIIVFERFDAAAVLARLGRGDVTMFFGVPTMYVRLLERADAAAPPRLRLFVSGSAALSADLHAAFAQRFGSEILERYGATEFGFALSNRYGGPRVPGSVGVPTPGTRVFVARPSERGTNALERVPDGEVGEILVSGPSVFAGYWQMREASAAAFAADAEGTRWYRSGDLGRYDPERDVYTIVGRLKELIITGGFNVYPREIEDEIERFPGVRAAAVVGVADAARGELPVAFVETDGAFSADALLADLREKLASFKVPKAVHVVPSLPRNAMGKIEKARLREELAGER
ncbi:MAG: AMP-binding protein [Candidatus Baltobacteraceae bacterium]|jgi:malonyl-CoA/methylmalonyl-CoA synthetase